jgi:ferredoxin/flavodoxin---NADP+ reductase
MNADPANPMPADSTGVASSDPTNATLIERHDLNSTLSIVRVRPDSGRVPDFAPGQFITLGLPRPRPPEVATLRPLRPGRTPMTKRAYSISSPPHETESYELFVVLVTAGKLTPKLWTLNVGDRLWMDDQAKGEFTLAGVPDDRDLVMVSTGTGVAPFMSMLRTYRDQRRWRRLVMINGVRHPDDFGYRAELERICRQDSTIRYIPIVSRGSDDAAWPGLRGRVQTALDDAVYRAQVGTPLEPDRCHVFLCGNPAMIDDVEKLLQQRGFRTHTREAPGDIHLERYW